MNEPVALGSLPPRRVLHVYSGNLYGGVEAMLVTMARERETCPGLEPHFALAFDDRLADELRAAGVPVTILGSVRVRRPWSLVGARRALRRALVYREWGSVVCHAPWSHAVFAPAVRAAGVPLAFWMHDAAHGTHWTERWARRSVPDLVFHNSRFTGATLPLLFPSMPTSVLLHCPVALPAPMTLEARREVRLAVRREFGTAVGATVVVQVARPEPWKGHDRLLAALGAIGDSAPAWECWMVGGARRPHEHRYLERLTRQAEAVGISARVRWLGERSDVRRLLIAADIACHPNAAPEPFGIAAVEALAAGIPVVAIAAGGPAEIVTAECGVLVPPGDIGALASALGALIRDPARRGAMGAAGPARARAISDPATRLRDLHAAIAAQDMRA